MDEVDSIPENTRKIRVHVASHYAVHRRDPACFDQLCSKCGRSLAIIAEHEAAALGESDMLGQLGFRGGAFVVIEANGWHSSDRRVLSRDEEFCS